MTQVLSDFQHEVIAKANVDGRLIYADPMGARKTATTLVWLAQRDSACRTIVVAPTQRIVKQWASQAEVWYPDALVFVGLGSAAHRANQLHLAAGGYQRTVYITTYDSMKADDTSLYGLFDTYIFDEGHKLKGRTTQVARCAYKLTGAKNVANILCVTGTPVLNSADELWFYLHLLYRQDFRSFWQWVEEHFVVQEKLFKGRRQTVRIIGDYLPGHDEVVRRQLAGVLIQREDEELFPEAQWVQKPEFFEVVVELSDEERKLYDQMVNNSWSNFPHKTVTASNQLVVRHRLRQFTSDWGNADATVGNGAKVKRAVELIPQLVKTGGPVVVFCEYKETANRIFAGLTGRVYACRYHGDIHDREGNLSGFIAGDFDVIVGTYGLMREGVDGLQHRSHQMVMVDLLWVPGLNDQAIGRLRRDGQKQRVKVWRLYAKDTTDNIVLQANLRKVNVWKTIRNQPLIDVIYGRSMDVQVEDE